MHSRGKIVVLSIFAVALGMASFALWWNWGQGRRSLAFWGKEGGLAIRDAKSIQLLKLKTTASVSKECHGELFKRDGVIWEVTDTKDVTGEHGLVHARHAFLEDASFQWEEKLPAVGPDWQYAVRFRAEAGDATVLLDLKEGIAESWEQNRAVRLSPKTAGGWKQFIRRYFPEEGPKAPSQLREN